MNGMHHKLVHPVFVLSALYAWRGGYNSSMFHVVSQEPVDYLAVGHITVDLTPDGPALGGSVLYAGLTARALGLRVGIVTVRGNEVPLPAWEGIQVVQVDAETSTTFENIRTEQGRIQYLHHRAPLIDLEMVPPSWRTARILHLAPVAGEVAAVLPKGFQPALLGLTPQGWLRTKDAEGRVHACDWPDAETAAQQASAVVLSVEDVEHHEEKIEHLAHHSRLLAVTDGPAGARLFWHGDSRRFRAPQVEEVDATGAGDIFAASFFVRLLNTRDPWESARFAVQMATHSVRRRGLGGIPTREEIDISLMEVLH